MKSHRGFITPLLLALVAILLIGGGAYWYEWNKHKCDGGDVCGAFITEPSTTSFTASPMSGIAPLATNFFSNWNDAISPQGLRIDYGDGETDYLCNPGELCGRPAHIYKKAGTFVAKLISGPVGSQGQVLDTVIITVTSAISGTSKYSDTSFGFSFEYPTILTESIHGANVVLTHLVKYPHADVCDMKGGAPSLQNITDFSVAITVRDTNLETTIQETGNAAFKASGDLKPITIGNNAGYVVARGVEGCGEYQYLFPLADGRTLFVKRAYVTELSTSVSNYKTYRAVAGVIQPDQEQAYFDSIIASFKLNK